VPKPAPIATRFPSRLGAVFTTRTYLAAVAPNPPARGPRKTGTHTMESDIPIRKRSKLRNFVFFAHGRAGVGVVPAAALTRR